MIRYTTVLFILLAGALSLVVFGVKYQVQDLEHELTTLNRDIKGNERSIHVLNAEWSHMNNPKDLKELAERHLGMQPIQTKQLAEWSNLDERLAELDLDQNQDQDVSYMAKRINSPVSLPPSPLVADRMTDQRRNFR
ncbi:MAG: cell division protein FtsL [Rhodospirillales bacterium]|jgi:cell division protein FtsL